MTDRTTAADGLAIAGLTPLSSCDWPGRLVATAFLQGCPWRCTYCHNAAILDPRTPGVVPWSDVRDLLDRRRGLLDGVVFSGGEPTRQAGLVDAARQVRDA
ncbi:radical SAM protein, partial [Cellulomonas fimi]